MRLLKGDLLDGQPPAAPLTASRRQRRSFLFSPFAIAALFVGSFLVGRASLSESASAAFASFENVPILRGVSHLMSSPERSLIGEHSDQINILLMGMGGEGHEGPYLTDTIMLASVKPSENRVALLSIPRDLLVPVEDYGWRKINSVNAYGELEARGRGGELARTTMENLLGMEIPYYVRVDFKGFRELIDGLGGVDVHVDRAFTDASYPTEDYLTQTVSFEEGWQRMDGETALRYSRSRHGNNGEGSDFARAKRQQKVLTAAKDKLLSMETYRSPAVIRNTLAALQSNVTTDIKLGEIVRFVRMAQDMEDVRISHTVIDNGPGSPLVSAIIEGAYVLVPRDNDWTLLRAVAAGMFEDGEIAADAPAPAPPADATPAGIELLNGSGRAGAARDVAATLTKAGFDVRKIGNADTFDHDATLIYDLTDGDHPATLAKLRTTLSGAETASRVPAAIRDTAASGIDFVVILGAE